MPNNIIIKSFEFTHGESGRLAVQVGWSNNIVFENNIFHTSYSNDLLKLQNTSATVKGNVFYNQSGPDQHIEKRY